MIREPKVQICAILEVRDGVDLIEGVERSIRDAFPSLTLPRKPGALPPHMTILTGSAQLDRLHTIATRIMEQAVPFSLAYCQRLAV